jgi:hypothetical protein
VREIILTDIHGCYDEMMRLLDDCNFGPGDIIVGASDCVDKGPDSAKVIKTLHQLKSSVKNLLGNHEMKFLRFVKSFRKDPDKAMQRKNAQDMHRTLSGLDDSDITWLKSGATWLKLQNTDSIVVHAGIEPALRHLPEQWPQDKKVLDSASPLWFTRYVKNGRMIRLGEEDESCHFWADVYDGRFGHVFYGHQPFFIDSPRVSQFATGLDLAGVMGGLLCAAVVDEAGVVSYHTVRCPAYASKNEIYPE